MPRETFATHAGPEHRHVGEFTIPMISLSEGTTKQPWSATTIEGDFGFSQAGALDGAKGRLFIDLSHRHTGEAISQGRSQEEVGRASADALTFSYVE